MRRGGGGREDARVDKSTGSVPGAVRSGGEDGRVDKDTGSVPGAVRSGGEDARVGKDNTSFFLLYPGECLKSEADLFILST